MVMLYAREVLRPFPWSAKEHFKLETAAHLLPLVGVMDPEVPLMQVKPGIIYIAAQDIPLQARAVEWFPSAQLWNEPSIDDIV